MAWEVYETRVQVHGPLPTPGGRYEYEIETDDFRYQVAEGPLWRWRVERAVRWMMKRQRRHDRRVAEIDARGGGG